MPPAQMIQLSLDGKRLYVTNSLLSGWDKQVIGTSMASHGCCANSGTVGTVDLNQDKSNAACMKAVINHLPCCSSFLSCVQKCASLLHKFASGLSENRPEQFAESSSSSHLIE